MSIQSGTVVALKTSGERVFVMQQQTDMPASFKGVFLAVRRPVQSTENGISHVVETYREDELESIEDNLNRDLDEMKLKMKLNKKLSEFQDSLIEDEVNKKTVTEAKKVTPIKVVN